MIQVVLLVSPPPRQRGLRATFFTDSRRPAGISCVGSSTTNGFDHADDISRDPASTPTANGYKNRHPFLLSKGLHDCADVTLRQN